MDDVISDFKKCIRKLKNGDANMKIIYSESAEEISKCLTRINGVGLKTLITDLPIIDAFEICNSSDAVSKRCMGHEYSKVWKKKLGKSVKFFEYEAEFRFMEDIRKAGYDIIKKLGKGGFSNVWLSEDIKNGKKVALKIFKISKKCQKNLEKEINILEKISKEPKCNKYIVCYYNHFIIKKDNTRACILVMEYVTGETLKEYSKSLDAKEREKVLNDLAYETIKGIKELHDRDIIHRDIKPDNIMVTKEGNIKLIDVGLACLAKMCQEEMLFCCKGFAGSPNYVAPETFLNETSYFVTDIWGTAAAFYMALTFKNVISNKNLGKGQTGIRLFYQRMRSIFQHRPEELPRVHTKYVFLNALINKGLVIDYEKRISVSELLEDFVEKK